MTRHNAAHVLLSGPFAGRTVAEKRNIKRRIYGGPLVEQLQVAGAPLAQPLPRVRRRRFRRRGVNGNVPQLVGQMERLGIADRIDYSNPRDRQHILNFATEQMAIKDNRKVVSGVSRYSGLSDLISRGGIPNTSEMRMLGSTEAGRRWALAALNPCGEGVQEACMTDTFSQAVNDYVNKLETEIFYDSGMFTTAPGASPTWSCQIWAPPIPEIAYCYRIRNDQANVWSNTKVVRHVPNASRYNGMFLCLSDNGYSQYRIVGKGLNMELNAARLNDQGRVVSGQINPFSEVKDLTPYNSGVVGNPNNQILASRSIQYMIPSDEQTLVQLSSNPWEAEARCGAYAPLKFVNPLMGYQFHRTGNDKRGLYTTGTPAVTHEFPQSFLVGDYGNTTADEDSYNMQFTTDSYTGWTNLPDNFPSSSNMHPGVSDPCDITTTVTFFIGMSLGGTATNPGLAATIRVKSRQYIEAYSAVASPTNVYSHPPPLWDEEAVRAVVRVQQEQPDAYPSSYNDFGSIMGKIFGILRKFSQPFRAVAPYIPIPGLSTVASIGDDVIGAGDKFFNTDSGVLA